MGAKGGGAITVLRDVYGIADESGQRRTLVPAYTGI